MQLTNQDAGSPVVMRGLDSGQFGQAVEEADVPGCGEAAGHQVVEGAADVDHHIAGRCLLVAVAGQLGHQVVHHLGGCAHTHTHGHMMPLTWSRLQYYGPQGYYSLL